ncbi:hypothetical protein CONLIGDRAFT_684206 [Coniochaeta ligniaria NRRL 30616]|uniref:Uncharacterized protein n=1 Tax=Coniochaeta ligniaria NRRL 30616 TaxID=1408157 RepID=A0A1J7IE19_9PEZI|nr:hypothetical protein CONLIGDRAFT_684206 [Coniochaeta ligniaria NRRL 30616]
MSSVDFQTFLERDFLEQIEGHNQNLTQPHLNGPLAPDIQAALNVLGDSDESPSEKTSNTDTDSETQQIPTRIPPLSLRSFVPMPKENTMADSDSNDDRDQRPQKKQKRQTTDWTRILEQTTHWRGVPPTVQAVVVDRLEHSVTYDPVTENMDISGLRPWRIVKTAHKAGTPVTDFDIATVKLLGDATRPSTKWQDRIFAKFVEDRFAAATEAWNEATNLERMGRHLRHVVLQLDRVEAVLNDIKTNNRDRHDDYVVRFQDIDRRFGTVESTQTPPQTIAAMRADVEQMKHDMYNADSLEENMKKAEAMRKIVETRAELIQALQRTDEQLAAYNANK